MSLSDFVKFALIADIGSGDLTAMLLQSNPVVTANLITREHAVMAGADWVNEVYKQVDPMVALTWQAKDGDIVKPDQVLLTLTGPAQSIVTGERCAMNGLQTLMGTATQTKRYVDCLAGTKTKLLDTRKTLPGFRALQKHAVTMGGGVNHRMGLYDAFLIKENHIAACGGIKNAIHTARELADDKPVIVEVEDLRELQQALAARPDRIMLDNFSMDNIRKAVALVNGSIPLEITGNVTLKNIHEYAKTGVDFISVGATTKHVQAVDLSLRVI